MTHTSATSTTSETGDGRRTDDELTVFKSLGLAAEDLAAAEHVYARARAAGAGTTVPF